MSFNVVLATNAHLAFRGMNVTNQRIQVTQGAQLIVNCGGGQNHNWKIGAVDISTNQSANVYQIKSGIAVLFIKSVNPSNAGKYTCHISRTQESITFGESLIC